MATEKIEEEVVKFVRRKIFKKIKDIGQGGTGRTVFLFDEYINLRPFLIAFDH